MNNMPQPDGSPVAPQSWWSRNWKWVVPVGCLVPMLCCLSFVGATYFGVSKLIEGSPVFATALERASGHPEVKELLGEPLIPGFGVQGNLNESGEGGVANFSVPISGPKGKGKLFVEAQRVRGRWDFERIDVEAGGKMIDVLHGTGIDDPVDLGDEPPAE
jgi:hypothetical protein